jgi:thiamine-phosphate diphosphorylase
MLLCLVTDRRRLGAALGLPEGDWFDALGVQVEAAGRAGVDLIQVREGDLEGRRLADLVRIVLQRTAATSAKVLVNDRVDVALAVNAGGVQIKERSIPPSEVRRIAPGGFLIGCSVHGIGLVASRRDADFLITGTVLPTASKPAVAHLGMEGLRGVVEAAAGQPVLGIGGLDLPSIPLLASTGAAGLAAIGAFIPGAGEAVSEFVQFRVTEMRKAFDSARART